MDQGSQLVALGLQLIPAELQKMALPHGWESGVDTNGRVYCECPINMTARVMTALGIADLLLLVRCCCHGCCCCRFRDERWRNCSTKPNPFISFIGSIISQTAKARPAHWHPVSPETRRNDTFKCLPVVSARSSTSRTMLRPSRTNVCVAGVRTQDVIIANQQWPVQRSLQFSSIFLWEVSKGWIVYQ